MPCLSEAFTLVLVQKRSEEPPSSLPKGFWTAVIATVVVLAAAAALALWSDGGSKRAVEQPPNAAPGKAQPSARTPAKPADCKPLLGRWVRTDTPYVIEIKEAGADGKLKAAYFNPQPINVSRAEAGEKDGKLTVFVELRDVNYPGCTYRLTYEKGDDALVGVYFQAALQQEYEIAFAREPQEK